MEVLFKRNFLFRGYPVNLLQNFVNVAALIGTLAECSISTGCALVCYDETQSPGFKSIIILSSNL